MKRDMLKGVKIIVPEIFSDERGNFSENFNQKKFNETTNTNFYFVQDNKNLIISRLGLGTALQILWGRSVKRLFGGRWQIPSRSFEAIRRGVTANRLSYEEVVQVLHR